MDDRAEPVVEDRVILVLAGNRVAMAAALAQAAELGRAEIPAARTLQEVAADRGDGADLRARRFARRLRQRRIAFADRRVGRETGERDHRLRR